MCVIFWVYRLGYYRELDSFRLGKMFRMGMDVDYYIERFSMLSVIRKRCKKI